ncbi:MAG TPA: glycoside hydrolase [Selenomonadales bacterium]|nr:glycoside hydrolase [Selenomonadales bacterium]
MEIRVGKYNLTNILAGPPKLTDQLEAVCRTLDFTLCSPADLPELYGSPVELWYRGGRWFFGFLFVQEADSSGQVTCKAYDPLYYMKKAPDDYYFKGMTASQGLRALAERTAIVAGSIADTGAVLDQLYYAGKTPDKIAIDLLARSYRKNGRKFWFRFNPEDDPKKFGLEVFERVRPQKAWAFQYGVNLTRAAAKGTIEETTPVVRFLNRETGKQTLLVDAEAMKSYGHMIRFREVNKNDATAMAAEAKDLFEQVKVPRREQSIEGINPEGRMPMFRSGDLVYAEEKRTRLCGGYYIKNVVQTFHSERVVGLAMDLVLELGIPPVQYEDQAGDQKKIEATPPAEGGLSANEQYRAAMESLLKKYESGKDN